MLRHTVGFFHDRQELPVPLEDAYPTHAVRLNVHCSQSLPRRRCTFISCVFDVDKANFRIMETVASRLGLPMEKVSFIVMLCRPCEASVERRSVRVCAAPVSRHEYRKLILEVNE